MPSVILNKTVLETLVGKKLSLDKLKERISYLGTALECIENDDIHVEIFPKRPDMLSEQGFGRAFASFIGAKPGLREYNVKKSGYMVIVDKSVTMRPYTACAIVKNVVFNDERIREIMQIQEKLSTTHGRKRKKSEYGLYPLEKINFPVSYVAKDPKTIMFRPLGFKQEIRADKVEEIHPTGKEFKYVAQGWTKYPFFIDNRGKVLSMLPYTNSDDLGKVETTTKEMFVECTGINLENVNIALNILTTTLADMGGEIYSIDIVYPDKTVTTPNLTPKKMKIDMGYINKRLGLNLNEKNIQKFLERMGHKYDPKTKTVHYPAYRADILHPVDFIEEIAIAYGYENFNPVLPNIASTGKENSFEKIKKKIAYLLVGLGYLECNTYHLINGEELKKMNYNAEFIELRNSCSIEHSALRSWILPSIMQVLKTNTHNEYPQKLFDLSVAFKKNAVEETNIEEIKSLAVASAHSNADFTEIRQVMEYLLRMLNLSYKFEETEHPSFIAGRVVSVSVNNAKVGYLGEIHPAVLQNFGLEVPVAAFEINVAKLL